LHDPLTGEQVLRQPPFPLSIVADTTFVASGARWRSAQQVKTANGGLFPLAIADVTEPGEAEQHHRPRGWFGNRALDLKEMNEEPISSVALSNATSNLSGVASKEGRPVDDETNRPPKGLPSSYTRPLALAPSARVIRKLPLEDEYSNEMKVVSSTIPLSSSKKSTSVRTPVAVPVQPESQTPLKSKTVSARAGAA
jgi:hypothetical protein